MPSIPPDSSLVRWYRSAVRRVLESLDPSRVESTDAEAARLETLENSFSQEVPVCFLGASGIGKSTLINALVGESLLPHGGIGPLTAQALMVRYGEQSAFEVYYHTPGRIGRLAFAIQKTHEAALRREGKSVKTAAVDDLLDLVGSDEAGEFAVVESDDAADVQTERNRGFQKQAVLMVAGRQDAERAIPYLIDRLREIIGKTPLFRTDCLPEDQARVADLRDCLILGKKGEPFLCSETSEGFRSALHHHAAGYVAPIIRELVVRWNSEILKHGIVLIDLPGVGIAGDVHARVTEKFIREKAKVVVLVVSVRGVTQSDAELLRNSGFLNRLLHAADDPASDPVQLAAVVVRADDIADTRYAADNSRAKREHFADVCFEAARDTKTQLRDHLLEAWRTDETLTKTKQEVLDRIMEHLQVHPVSAVQYRRVLANDEDDRAFIKDPEESNVPKLARDLVLIASSLNGERRKRLEKARALFFSSLTTNLRLIREQWQSESRVEEEAQALRSDLEEILEPIRKEFHGRRGAFRAFLRDQVPSEIEKLVLEARVSAQTSIRRYLGGLRNAHWSTLRAAVRRGGTFYGARHIDLPNDFALRFEEPIAEIWGKKLLQLIRNRTKSYAEDCAALVEQILGWAQSQGARVKTTLLEAQRNQIKADAEQLTAVGKELINELREEVKNRLITSIRKPIRKKCERFVEAHEDIGVGVMQRILELFAELADDVVAAAAEPAFELLTARFADVEREIAKVLRADQDPIENAAEAIVQSHEVFVQRSDAQRRKGVLKQLSEVEAVSPLPWPDVQVRQHAAAGAA